TVAKYMARPRKPSSQTWKTFLKNHMGDMVATDFFVVPTVTFRLLFVFLVLSHDRRRIVHFGITAHPTAEWTAQQLVDAFPVGKRTSVLAARPRWQLWRTVSSNGPSDADSGGSHSSSLALAECLCREADRFHPPRLPRPCVGLQRMQPPAHSEVLLRLL